MTADQAPARLDAAVELYAQQQRHQIAQQQIAAERRKASAADKRWLAAPPKRRAAGSDAPVFAASFPSFSWDDDQATSQPSSAPASQPADIWSREKLTGDWFGLRKDLKDHGVKINLRLTQYYQGVAYGGANTNFAYGGKLDYIFDIDGQKLGLWPGLFVNMHAETLFGDSINGDAGGFALPNTTMLYPLPNEHETAITQLMVMQALSKNFALTAGKINVIDLWTMVYPRTGGGVDGFMNTNMLAAAVPFLRWVNLSVLGAGALVLTDDEQIQGGLLVFDTNNSTTTTGFSDAFHSGAGILGLWRFFFDIDEKPGRVLFAFGGSTRDYFALEESSFEFVGASDRERRRELRPTRESGAWSAAVMFDQVLWQHPDDPKRDLWFFTGWAMSDGSPSFGRWGGFASLEARGLLFGREHDRAGVGAFYNQLSSNFTGDMSDLGVQLRNIWGAELYYNVAITPWFHLTPNLQVVQNQNRGDDPAVIAGFRAVIDF